MARSKKDHLVETATKLCLKHGYHNTGIDLIIKEAGIAKMTLYNHFDSKNDLILEVVKRYDQQFKQKIIDAVEAISTDPLIILISLFDVYKSWFEEQDFYGCAFQKASSEFYESDDPVHLAAQHHDKQLKHYIHQQCQALNVSDSDALTQQIHLLLKGSVVEAQLYNTSDSADEAKDAAKILIQAYV